MSFPVPTVTVTGNALTISGQVPVARIDITLTNYGEFEPQVVGSGGTGVILRIVQSVRPDHKTGAFSVDLYKNNVIDPGHALIPPTTYYTFQYFDAEGNEIASLNYQFVADGTFDITGLAILNPPPNPPVPGSGSILLETNSVPNPTQNVLNLISGSNIALTPDAFGGVVIGATALSVLLETNSVPNTLQSVLNLKAGTNIVLTPDAFGAVTLDVSGTFSGSFTNITTGTNISATMVVGSGATLTSTGTGVIEATELATTSTPVTISGSAPTHQGQLLISQPGNTTALWADPFVQGPYAPGTNTSTGGISGAPINPVLIGGSDYAGTPLLHDWKVDSTGLGYVSVVGTVTSNVQASGTPLTATGSSLNVNITGGSTSGTQYTGSPAVGSGAVVSTLASGYDGSNVRPLNVDGAGRLNVVGAVSVTQTTSPWVVNDQADGTVGGTSAPTFAVQIGSYDGTHFRAANINSSGYLGVQVQNSTLAVTQSTSPWVISGTDSDNAANSTSKLPVLAARANTSNPSWTDGREVPLSVDANGNLRTTATFSGTVSSNIIQWSNTNLGAPSTFGTSPGAVSVIGANVSIFAGTTGLTATGSSLNTNITNSTLTVDVTDRAARLVGVVYGSQAQQLKQTATNFNLAVETYVGAGAIDPRQIRTLTVGDSVTAAQGTAASLSAYWPVGLSDGTNLIGTVSHPIYTTSSGGTINTGEVGTSATDIADWNSSTALNTTAAVLSANFTYNTVLITLNQAPTGTLTGGTVAFEASNDGSHWELLAYVIEGAWIQPSSAQTSYTLHAATYDTLLFNTSGWQYFRVRLSTVITGTGTVTVGYAAQSGGSLPVGLPTIVQGTVGVVGSTTGPTVSTAWTSATALNAELDQTNFFGYNTAVVSVVQTSTITTGAITFETSVDGSNWFALQGSGTNGSFNVSTYTLTASTNQGWNLNVGGWAYFRVRLSTAITGSGTVTVNVGMVTFPISPVTTVVTGSVNAAVTQSTSPWVENVSQFGGSNVVTGTGAAGAGIPRVTVSNDSNVLVTQSTSPWVNNITQVASTALGTPQTFGTAPTGVVIGTSSDIYVAGTRARSNQTTTAAGVMDTNIVGANGSTMSATHTLFDQISDGATTMGAMANFGTTPGAVTALNSNASIFAGTTGITATGSSLNVNITGGTAAGTQYTGSPVVAAGSVISNLMSGYDGANVRPVLISNTGQIHVIADGTVDVSDRAARLVGVIYGSQGQQITQTITNFNLATELFTGSTAYDARQIRALTSSDVVTVDQGTSPWIVGTAVTGGDAVSNTALSSTTSTDQPLVTAGFGYNGSTWDRLRTAGVGSNVASTGILAETPYGQFIAPFPSASLVPTSNDFGIAQIDSMGRSQVNLASGQQPFVIQSAHGISTGSVTTLNASFGSNNTAGNTIVVVAASGSNGAMSVTDTLGNTYTQATNVSNSTTLQVAIFYATNCKAGANTNVTLACTSSSAALEIYEVNGLWILSNQLGQAVSGEGQTNSNTGSSVSPSVSVIYPLLPNQFAFSALAVGTANVTFSAFSPYSKDFSANTGGTQSGLFSFASFSQPLNTVQATSFSATLSGSEPWAACTVFFKPTALTVQGSVVLQGQGSSGTLNTASIKPGSVTAVTTDTSLVVQLHPLEPVLSVTTIGGSTTVVTQGTASNLLAQVSNNGTFAVQAAQSGAWTVSQATAASLNATVVGTGTFAVQAAQSGNWTDRIVGNAGGIMDFAGQNATQPASALLIGGEFNTTPTTISNGNASPFQLDANGNLLVNVKAGSTGNAAAGATGSAPPADADYLGVLVGSNLRGVTGHNPAGATYAIDCAIVDASGNQITSFGAGVQYTDGQTVATITGTVAFAANSGKVYPLQLDAADGNLLTKINSALPTGSNVIGHVITNSGSTTVVTGSVSVTQGSTWNVNQTSGVAGFEKITDGTNTATVKPAQTGATARDSSLVVTPSPMAGIPANTPVANNIATTAKTVSCVTVAVAQYQTVIVTAGSGNWAASNWSAAVSDGTNTYVLDNSAVQGTTAWSGVFRSTNSTQGTYTITFTISGTNSANTTVQMEVYVVDGILEPASPLDQTATGTNGGSTSVTTSTVYPQGPNELTFCAIAAAGAETSITAGGAWTADYTSNDSVLSFASLSQLLPAMAGISGTATLASSVAWSAAMVTYRTPAENVQGTVSARLQDGIGNSITSDARGSARPLAVEILDASGNQITTFGGVQYADNAASGGTPTGTLASGWDSGASKVRALKVDGSQNLEVVVNAALPAGSNVIGHVIADSGSTTAVTGNVTVVQGTGTNLHAVLDSGSTTAVTQSTAANLNCTAVLAAGSAVIGHVITDSGSVTAATLSAETTKVIGVVRTADGAGNLLTSNSSTFTSNHALDGNLLGTLGTAFTTAGFVDIKGADGNVFVRQATASNLNATVVQGATAWVTNLTQVATTALGTPQTFGTAPTGVVIGTSSDLYVAGTRARSNQTTTAAGVVDVNIVGTLGVTAAKTNGVWSTITDNTNQITIKPASTASVATDTSLVVEINPNQPTAMFTGTVPGTAPGNTILIGGKYTAAGVTLTDGQTAPFQVTSSGALIVNSGASVGTVGSSAPTSADLIGWNTGNSMQAVSDAFPLPVTVQPDQNGSPIVIGGLGIDDLAPRAFVSDSDGFQILSPQTVVGIQSTNGQNIDVKRQYDGSHALQIGQAPSNYPFSAAVTAAVLVKGGACLIDNMSLLNTTATIAYVQFFDVSSVSQVTLGTTAPAWQLALPANSTTGAGAVNTYLRGTQHVNGLVIAATTTAGGSSTASCFCTIWVN